jgi:hypothetical protein
MYMVKAFDSLLTSKVLHERDELDIDVILRYN